MKKTPVHSKAAFAKEGIGELGTLPKKLHTAEEYAAEGIGTDLKTEKSK